MELHPFLEHDTRPNPGWWYVVPATGDCPSMRVGHTATHVPGNRPGDAGKVFVVGGANPSGPFCETFVLDLNTRAWDTVDCPGLRPRYEHAAFAPASKPGKIYIFGGANQAGNLNDIQVLDTATLTWSTLTVNGPPPAPRTHHTTACAGDRLVIYSGGQAGPDPVGDRQVHVFDAREAAWSALAPRGDSPKPRHGHAMAAVGDKVFLHGGMAGTTFYDDLHVLDLDRRAWTSPKRRRGAPCARAAHVMLVHGAKLFVFGGMNRDGALDDLHCLDTSSMTWSAVELQGPAPACRLDLAACVVTLAVTQQRPLETDLGGNPTPADLAAASGHAREVMERELKPGSASSRDSWTDVNASEAFFPIEAGEGEGERRDEDKGDDVTPRALQDDDDDLDTCTAAAASPEQADGQADGQTDGQTDTVHALMLNGGMDTQGEIFDDTLVFLLS